VTKYDAPSLVEISQSGRIDELRPVETAGVRGVNRDVDEKEVPREVIPAIGRTQYGQEGSLRLTSPRRRPTGTVVADSDPLEPAPHSALIGDIGADLCVIGAGYTGLWTALLAKERDPSVKWCSLNNTRRAAPRGATADSVRHHSPTVTSTVFDAFPTKSN